MFNSSHLQSIIKARDNDTLTVFVGAGFSKFSETETAKFPSWDELMRSLCKDLQIDENDYLKLAQLYYLEFGEYRLYEKLKENIPLHANPSDLHKLLFDLNPKNVITTNWDNLLEKTVNEQGLIYDIIKNDVDFVKSTLPQKVIKIHGDLESHNIVFKEDDYLNFALNKPLLDNFLRHILSSTTVLFLGYSYSDDNLKHIVKWIEKHSAVSPPRFLLSLSSSPSQTKYYENHHIKVITPNSDTIQTYKEVYVKFFDYLNENELLLLDNSSEDEVLDYFLDKLKHLAELESILPKQITNLFSNTEEEYHNNCFGIHFYNDDASFENSIKARQIHGLFCKMLKNILHNNLKNTNPTNKVLLILQYFIRANIYFVQHDGYISVIEVIFKIIYPKFNLKYTKFNLYGSNTPMNKKIIYGKNIIYALVDSYLKETIKLDKKYESFITFSRSMPKNLFLPIVLQSKHEILEFTEEIKLQISQTKRERKFIKSLIHHFNYNLMVRKILNNPEIESEIRQNFTKYYNSSNAILSLDKYPYEVKKNLSSILDFLEFRLVYEFYYESNIDNLKNIGQAKSNKSWGAKLSFHSKEQRSNNRLVQLLHFIANNEINIDMYSQFLNLMQSYMKGKLELQSINERFELKNYDLFILIKYFELQELINLIDKNILPFYKKQQPKKKIFIFSQDEKNYLFDTFKNLCELFEKYPASFQGTIISRSLVNTVALLSLIDWDETELSEIINLILNLAKKFIMPYDTYKALNLFVFYNYKIYQKNHLDFSKLLDIPLQKIVNDTAPIEYHSIKGNFYNPFGYLDESKIKYSNEKLMRKTVAILEISENIEWQRKIVKDFLIRYWGVSDEATKKILEQYIEKIRIFDWDRPFNIEEVSQELIYNVFGLSVKKDFIKFLNSNVDNILADKTREGFLSDKSQIIRLLEIMSNERNDSEYKKLVRKIKERES